MQQGDHGFDWSGFRFALILAFLCVTLAGVAHWGTAWAVQYVLATQPARIAHAEPIPHALPAAVLLASTTPERVINRLTIADTVPPEGKFIAADLRNMKMHLYQDGVEVGEFVIKTKGKPGTPWETPSGFYAIGTKEKNHFSTIGKVYMPYSMQFYGNYFIHGWTYYPDGTPTSATFSGGCIKLDTEDAAKVFAFADVGTKVFVYDPKQEEPPPPIALASLPPPTISAPSYMVADMDSGDVYIEAGAGEARPVVSATKLMTALVANETISLDKKVAVFEGSLVNPPLLESYSTKVFLVNDLFYPLLMQSSNLIADALADYYGKKGFVGWMNTTARALGMTSTKYVDPSGVSAGNVSTTDDLFRLAVYLSNKKSFVLKITNLEEKTIVADDGSVYKIQNVNAPASEEEVEGGKAGHTRAAADTMLSVLPLKVDGETRRVAIVVLGSVDQKKDTEALASWINEATKGGTEMAACATCAGAPTYRKIEL